VVLVATVFRVKFVVLGSGPRCWNRNRRGRDTCEPIGKWMKPACEMATGRERKKV
jgi:hypothetical protein